MFTKVPIVVITLRVMRLITPSVTTTL